MHNVIFTSMHNRIVDMFSELTVYRHTWHTWHHIDICCKLYFCIYSTLCIVHPYVCVYIYIYDPKCANPICVCIISIDCKGASCKLLRWRDGLLGFLRLRPGTCWTSRQATAADLVKVKGAPGFFGFWKGCFLINPFYKGLLSKEV